MRDPDRIDKIIELIRANWKNSPDLRFGQFVTMIYYQYAVDVHSSSNQPYLVEDASFLKWLENFRGFEKEVDP